MNMQSRNRTMGRTSFLSFRGRSIKRLFSRFWFSQQTTPHADIFRIKAESVSTQKQEDQPSQNAPQEREPMLALKPNTDPDVFEQTLDVLHFPVVIVGPRNRINYVNTEAKDLFGVEAVGRNFALLLRDQEALLALDEVLVNGGSITKDIILNVRTKRDYKLVMTRLPNIAGSKSRVALEFQENTLMKRTESMRSEFVANVSHELRSPLATLIGFIETIQSTCAEDGQTDMKAQSRFLGIMEGEAHRMSRMIDDLLSLINVELREHERPRIDVDLHTLLAEVTDSLMVRARQLDVEIVLDVSADLPNVYGDRDQLIQVFHNLITNAIKYGANGHRVEISATQLEKGLLHGESSVQVQVTDFGDGIEADHIPRLTERFYRADKGRSRAMGGTGLGLAIVKHIINRHRGRFHVESTVGEGATFSVSLPLFTNKE